MGAIVLPVSFQIRGEEMVATRRLPLVVFLKPSLSSFEVDLQPLKLGPFLVELGIFPEDREKIFPKVIHHVPDEEFSTVG